MAGWLTRVYWLLLPHRSEREYEAKLLASADDGLPSLVAFKVTVNVDMVISLEREDGCL
jgi:hypothetical protein